MYFRFYLIMDNVDLCMCVHYELVCSGENRYFCVSFIVRTFPSVAWCECRPHPWRQA